MIRQFGRFHSPDSRDRLHLLHPKRSTRQSRSWRSDGWHGDQLDTPHCVGFAWTHWLNCSPIRQYLDPHGIYTFAQFCDEWEGQDYDGTSVRGGAKALSSLGAIGEYKWATTAEQVANHILDVGPVVVGTDWLGGMFAPDDEGLIRAVGGLTGGHAYCLTGFSRKTNRFKLKQSWGQLWGVGGYAYLSYADLDKLLKADGEACVGTELKISEIRS